MPMQIFIFHELTDSKLSHDPCNFRCQNPLKFKIHSMHSRQKYIPQNTFKIHSIVNDNIL